MHLQTMRLQLRDFTLDDLPTVYAYTSLPVVARYLSYGPLTEDECRNDLAFYVEQQQATGRIFFHFAIILHSENRLIGDCGLQIKKLDLYEAELSYILHPAYWDQGYMTEAVAALLTFGFTTLHLHRIFASCDPHNTAAERVLHKIGMRKEGHLREAIFIKDSWHDCLIYAILNHEWPTTLTQPISNRSSNHNVMAFQTISALTTPETGLAYFQKMKGNI